MRFKYRVEICCRSELRRRRYSDFMILQCGSNVTNVWWESLTPLTLALSCEVVHEKLCKSVNICNSYGEKLSGTFLCGHRVYEFAMVCDCVGAADCS